MPETPDAAVTDNTAQSRFDMTVDGRVAFVAYRRETRRIVLLHAEVPLELEGRGIGSRLVRATLDAIRPEGLRVVPRCPFIAAFIAKNPAYGAMVDAGDGD